MKLALREITSTAAVCALAICAHVVLANPGSVDPSFNGGSVARFAIGDSVSPLEAVFALPGNKLLIVSRCLVGSQLNACAVRLEENGGVDSTYGTNGATIFASSPTPFVMTGFALQPDGKLVVAGACSALGWQFCAERFHSNGSIDTGFGVGGRTVVGSTGTNNGAWAVALQADGKIVMSGQCLLNSSTNRFCSVRLNMDGSLDTAFGTLGFASLKDSAGYQANAVAIQADGKIVVTGACREPGAASNDFCAQRYLESGLIDTSFGLFGEALAKRSDLNPFGRGIAVQPDSKYLVMSGGNVARFGASGEVDLSFGDSGVAAITNSNDVQLQPNGKFLSGCGADLCVVRYQDNGRIDIDFGRFGSASVNLPVGQTNGSAVLALHSDGRISAAGRCSKPDDASKFDICVVRYLGGPNNYENCKPDLDGDGVFSATVDALIFARIAVGMTGEAVLSGLTFPANATRNDWPKLRSYLGTNCGLKLP